jgi:23S rRNA (guanine745-N1)-methyltransferase
LDGNRLACARGHSFDIARQGYVNLTAGRAGPGTGDTADMVMARERFLGRGHYQPLAAAVRTLAARRDPGPPGLVADLAGGTGYYLASVLDALPGRPGVCIDLSAPALRRAAHAHRRAAALGADVWQSMPLADHSAALMLSIFGPRHAAEAARILAPGGTLIVVTPGAAHLRELQRPLGTISVDLRKDQRLASTHRDYTRCDALRLRYQLSLDHADLTAVVAMGPSARHLTPRALAVRVSRLPAPFTVTVDLKISAFRHRQGLYQPLPGDPQGSRAASRSARYSSFGSPRRCRRSRSRPPIG